MTNLNEVYKCAICGNIVEVVHTAGGQLVCCGQAMNLQVENTTDAAVEKHVPVIEKTENGYKVSVGEVTHPMIAEHYIEWIDLIVDGKVYRKNLAPTNEPMAEFCIIAETVTARAYCNQHGLWKV
ncbi:desulfoferrodoxin [Candidatus Parcubacteria bacterium]|nr:desulfoferrodoxin [Patescibacteria group bacterium]MBU4309691.1 desulfoferrodoxin [Patescibacteria group bacterium]MBU4431685.1 desulfoferrodoxin [Patescibacteria group bacterium]MBU4577921.1 desulfoferrodoxin [Patescibacteria group bacterium]MCG2696569.1 desulfoferrodoxin [Candidatus Parcubacteria bacterium]